ncbi:shikimate dehydrogenase [uncultured Flavobacterium sp.]|uniref:shikimate dehydrogenase family protein n=1 Tax=uncultured Flavobacterium sp. TaxID=165435 RepID=UPI0030CA27FE
MKKNTQKQKKYGLVGKNISYSFSKKYFTDKFKTLHFENCQYENFDIPDINHFKEIIKVSKGIKGLNVTIPYKEAIIPFLNSLSKNAKKIGSVNTVVISKKKKLKGYNTDYYGFKKSLKPMLLSHHKKALILGSGGASKGVAYALKKLNIEYDFVSRNADEFQISYAEIDTSLFEEYTIIINTTPLGTFPNVDEAPNLNYNLFTNKHIAFDLVYNPEETLFMKQAKANGAQVKNGLDMLVFQAEKSWQIWNK